MTGQPAQTDRDILMELKAMNRSVNTITAKVKQSLDPMERVVTAFSKASDMQVKAISMGFKSAGFQDSFDNVSEALKGVVPTLDSLDIAASLFEGGLKEVNKTNAAGTKLNNRGLLFLAANLVTTGKDMRLVADAVLPLNAELALNNERSNKLAESILKLNISTGMSVDSIIKLVQSIPGKDTFALLGTGGEFAAAAGELVSMFPDLAPQLNKVFESFFVDVAEGERLARTLDVFDQFEKALAAPSKQSLADFVTQVSQIGLDKVSGALKNEALNITSRVKSTQMLADSIIGDRRLLSAFNTLSVKIKDMPKGLFTEIPKKIAEKMADETKVLTKDAEFKNSVLNQLNLVFDPLEQAMKGLVPEITASQEAFREMLTSTGMVLSLLKGDIAGLLTYVSMPSLEGVNLNSPEFKTGFENLRKMFEQLKPIREGLSRGAVNVATSSAQGWGMISDFIIEPLIKNLSESLGLPADFEGEIKKLLDTIIKFTGGDKPGVTGVGALIPTNQKTAMLEQLAMDVDKRNKDILSKTQDNLIQRENIDLLNRIAKSNEMMANEKKPVVNTPLQRREGNAVA